MLSAPYSVKQCKGHSLPSFWHLLLSSGLVAQDSCHSQQFLQLSLRSMMVWEPYVLKIHFRNCLLTMIRLNIIRLGRAALYTAVCSCALAASCSFVNMVAWYVNFCSSVVFWVLQYGHIQCLRDCDSHSPKRPLQTSSWWTFENSCLLSKRPYLNSNAEIVEGLI